MIFVFDQRESGGGIMGWWVGVAWVLGVWFGMAIMALLAMTKRG